MTSSILTSKLLGLDHTWGADWWGIFRPFCIRIHWLHSTAKSEWGRTPFSFFFFFGHISSLKQSDLKSRLDLFLPICFNNLVQQLATFIGCRPEWPSSGQRQAVGQMLWASCCHYCDYFSLQQDREGGAPEAVTSLCGSMGESNHSRGPPSTKCHWSSTTVGRSNSSTGRNWSVGCGCWPLT